MSEDLTDFLNEHQVKVRYLHSDIDTVERTEIIRDLRLGVFDVLVGINLLREGLDIPEVSLVAILDADKEGFLRSERSLIQTIGRAARNSEGKAILYANKITKAMAAAIGETERRRAKQEEYNELHGIVPKTVHKKVADIMQDARDIEDNDHDRQNRTSDIDLNQIKDPKIVTQKIAVLEKKMMEHAKNLEFEEAAKVRDEIDYLKKHFI